MPRNITSYVTVKQVLGTPTHTLCEPRPLLRRVLVTTMSVEEVSSDFNLVGDKMDLVMSDVVIITKKEKAPPNYVTV